MIVLAISTTPAVDETIHVSVEPSRLNGLSMKGIVRCEQIMTISKGRLVNRLGILEPPYMQMISSAVRGVLDI
jgi:mRNA-degrading endonuclease toxin of MazEF toxin-antitoxin module